MALQKSLKYRHKLWQVYRKCEWYLSEWHQKVRIFFSVFEIFRYVLKKSCSSSSYQTIWVHQYTCIAIYSYTWLSHDDYFLSSSCLSAFQCSWYIARSFIHSCITLNLPHLSISFLSFFFGRFLNSPHLKIYMSF